MLPPKSRIRQVRWEETTNDCGNEWPRTQCLACRRDVSERDHIAVCEGGTERHYCSHECIAAGRPTPAGLPLTRPLVCLDIESTGTSATADRIIELGLVRLDPDGTRTPLRWLLNPGCPIPPASTAVHRITDADVAGHPGFVDVAAEVAAALADVDLAGFNLRAFDLPMLRAEFERAGVAWPCAHARVVDAMVLYHAREPRNLSSAVRLYLGRELEGAHLAVADAEATLDVLLAQIERYDLPCDLAALDLASGGRQPDWATECGRIRWGSTGDAVFAFGKESGKRLVDARGFVAWILRNDFPADVKALCAAVQRGERPRVPVPPPPPADLTDDDLPF